MGQLGINIYAQDKSDGSRWAPPVAPADGGHPI